MTNPVAPPSQGYLRTRHLFRAPGGMLGTNAKITLYAFSTQPPSACGELQSKPPRPMPPHKPKLLATPGGTSSNHGKKVFSHMTNPVAAPPQCYWRIRRQFRPPARTLGKTPKIAGHRISNATPKCMWRTEPYAPPKPMSLVQYIIFSDTRGGAHQPRKESVFSNDEPLGRPIPRLLPHSASISHTFPDFGNGLQNGRAQHFQRHRELRVPHRSSPRPKPMSPPNTMILAIPGGGSNHEKKVFSHMTNRGAAPYQGYLRTRHPFRTNVPTLRIAPKIVRRSIFGKPPSACGEPQFTPPKAMSVHNTILLAIPGDPEQPRKEGVCTHDEARGSPIPRPLARSPSISRTNLPGFGEEPQRLPGTAFPTKPPSACAQSHFTSPKQISPPIQ